MAVLHTPQKLFRTGLAVTIAVPISTIGNSALLIGAGYMIVNELGLTLAGCGVKPHSRRACRPDPPRPRSPNPRRGILVSPRLKYVENGVRRSLRRGYCRWQEGIDSDTSDLHGHHKIITSQGSTATARQQRGADGHHRPGVFLD